MNYNWKRLFFLLTIASMIVLIIAFLMRCCGCKSNHYSVFVFEYNKELIEHSKVRIMEEINLKRDDKVIINTFSATNKSGSFDTVKIEGLIKNEKKFEENIYKVIQSTIEKNVAHEITNSDANNLIAQMLQLINNQSKNTKICHTIFLVGSFPECYKNDDFEKIALIKKLNQENYSNIKIIWGLNSNDDEPEDNIKKELKEKNIEVIDKKIITKTRVCTEEELISIYAVLFKKLDKLQIDDFIDYLVNTFGEKLKVTIWNDSPTNNQSFNIIENNGKEELTSAIENSETGRWTSVGFLIKQANISLLQKNPDIEKNLIIVGNLPSIGRGNQLDIETWKSLQSINNLKTMYFLPKNANQNETDRLLLKGLHNRKFDIKIIRR